MFSQSVCIVSTIDRLKKNIDRKVEFWVTRISDRSHVVAISCTLNTDSR